MQNVQEIHRFKLGQSVKLAPGFGFARTASGDYEVIALLPSNGKHYQYRIRHSGEMFERIAAENELLLRQDS